MFDDFDELEDGNYNEELILRNGDVADEVTEACLIEPQPMVAKRQIQIDSFFQSNKRVKDLSKLGDITIKNTKYKRSQVNEVSTKIVNNLKHVKSRPRIVIGNEKPSVESSEYASECSNNNSSIPSQTSSKQRKIPELDTQRARIAKIAQYDTKHGSRHAENLQSTIKGVYCSVCDEHLKDMTQLFLSRTDGTILPTCHIATQKHSKNLETWLKTKRRSQSLVTLLSDVTPNVDRKVVDFRYDLLELLLRLRIPISVVNDQFFRDFISK